MSKNFEALHALTNKDCRNQNCKTLTDKFSLVFDGWTTGGTHYVAVFATFPRHTRDEIGYENVLLAFSRLEEEENMDPEDFKDFMEWVLPVFAKTIKYVVAILGGNCSTNRSLVTGLGVDVLAVLAIDSIWL